MRIGIYQFDTSSKIEENFNNIKEAVIEGSKQNVRLMIFHECALCGYPPIETPSVKEIDFEIIHIYLEQIRQLARQYNMYIGVGTIRKEDDEYYNSVQLFDPSGTYMEPYDKRALWGWDTDNFKKGSNNGIYLIDGVKIGVRICYEVRFPEYFRELFKSHVELVFVCFCDVSDTENEDRYNIIKSHLITRAVENVMTIISLNSISKYQTAPTGVFDPDGKVILEAARNKKSLLIYDYLKPETNFGALGRLKNSQELVSK